MRIAHLTWSFDYGGVETMLVDIINEQVKFCDVRLFIINDYYNKALLQTINPKVNVILLNRKPGSRNVVSLTKLNYTLFCFSPHLIHCHQANLSKVLWFSWRKVLTIHNTFCSAAYFNRYQRLFCISEAVKVFAANQGFFNSVVVYNGIHAENIDVKETYRNKERDKLKVICIGRLHPDKGQRVLVEALNYLINSRHLTDIICDFIGDGEDKGELESLVVQYKLTEHVKFVGFKSREWIYSHLKDYDTLVMPSVSEGFGLTLAEACAAKLPVVTSDLSGPLEVIAGGRLGVVFKHGDSIDLADKLHQFTTNPINTSVIEEAYSFSRAHFDVTKTAQQYICQYKELLDSKSLGMG